MGAFSGLCGDLLFNLQLQDLFVPDGLKFVDFKLDESGITAIGGDCNLVDLTLMRLWSGDEDTTVVADDFHDGAVE